MKKLNRTQAIAVFVSIGFVAYLLYGSTLASLFNQDKTQNTMSEQNATTGVQVQDVQIGTGAIAAKGDTLTVHYVGMLTDGRVFDSSVDRNVPFAFPLGAGQVIRGWEDGFVGMRVGGERRLIIAPDHAYGSEGVGSIPPNSTLIFDVKLLEVKKP